MRFTLSTFIVVGLSLFELVLALPGPVSGLAANKEANPGLGARQAVFPGVRSLLDPTLRIC
jgi:hypothetical protein